jgi:ParB/RepB/Spo0J family partition protein
MEIKTIELSKLIPDKNNPRKTIEEIKEIAESIKINGQLKPIDVEDLGNGKYIITDGHRRYLGAKMNNAKTIECMIKKVLDEKERRLRQAQIDAQTKPFEGRDKYALWRKIWSTNKYTKKEFAKKLGVADDRVNDFFDYEGLDNEIKELNINPGLIQETKSLKGETRNKILKYAHKTGKGAMGLRQDVRMLKDAEEELVDAFVAEDIDKEDVGKLKGLSKEKQQISIESMKHFKKQLKTIPDLVNQDKIKSVKTAPEVINAQQFVTKLQNEIAKTSVQMSALEGTLTYIADEKLDQYFTPVMKERLIDVLDDLNGTIDESVNKIKKTIGSWRKSGGK